MDNVVTAREFFRNPYAYLKQLPLVVTVNKVNRYVVTEYEDNKVDVVTRLPEVTPVGKIDRSLERIKLDNRCKKHGNPIGLCKFGCNK